MSTNWPVPIKAFEEIWILSGNEPLVYELSKFVSHKRHARKQVLSQAEHAFSLVANLQSWIEMEGFQDLFYQQYTLADCQWVENTLREIGADRLADLFAEAKLIYLRRRSDVTAEEFKKLEPFDIPEPDGTRFDEIAAQFYGDDSQLFDLADGLADFARRHRDEFSA